MAVFSPITAKKIHFKLKKEKNPKKAPKRLDIRKKMCYNNRALGLSPWSNLGVAQLVARYLGVVEAASSSLVTQTKQR